MIPIWRFPAPRRSKVKKTAEFLGFPGLHKLKLSCTSQCFT